MSRTTTHSDACAHSCSVACTIPGSVACCASSATTHTSVWTDVCAGTYAAIHAADGAVVGAVAFRIDRCADPCEVFTVTSVFRCADEAFRAATSTIQPATCAIVRSAGCMPTYPDVSAATSKAVCVGTCVHCGDAVSEDPRTSSSMSPRCICRGMQAGVHTAICRAISTGVGSIGLGYHDFGIRI